MPSNEKKQEPAAKSHKLVIATDSFLPRIDGISRFLIEIMPRLKSEFDIELIAPSFREQLRCSKETKEEIKNRLSRIKITRIETTNISIDDYFFPKPSYKKIKGILGNADLVFIQSIGPIGGLAAIAAKKLNKPVIAFAHSIDWELATKGVKYFKHLVNLISRIYSRYIYNKAGLIITPAEAISIIFESNRILAKKEVVCLGVDSEKFCPAKDKRKAKKALGISPESFVVSFINRIAREKDIITLYRAFRRLEKRHSNIKLLIVGGRLKELDKLFSSNRNIILAGKAIDVVPYYQASDVFVLPSLTETTSLSTLEAMSCGLPVIVTKVGFIRSYIKNNVNGMFFPQKNSLVLSMKIEKLINNKGLRSFLGGNARKTIKNSFSWEETAKKIISILKRYS